MAENLPKNIDLYSNGDTFVITFGQNGDIKFNNTEIDNALNSTITIALPSGLSFDTGMSTVVEGTFDEGTGIWNVGTVFGGGEHYPQASFQFVVDDSCEGPFDVNFTAAFDGCDCDEENNVICVKVDGISCCTINQCSETANSENIYAIPTSAFADTSRPTLAEVTTWATDTNNVPTESQDNGTTLTYTPLAFSETATYGDINVELVNLGPAEANTRIFRVTINGTDYDQDFIATSDAVFDAVAFKAFIDASLVTEGATGTVVVTEDIDGSTRVDVDITSNVGIESFGILSKSDATDPLESNYDLANGTFSNNGGRKSPSYIWTMNNDGGSISITEIFKAQDDGDVLYVRADGDDTVAEIGDPHKPYQTLRKALREAGSGDVVKFFIDEGENTVVDFEDFSGKQVHFIGQSSDAAVLLTFNPQNTVDASSLITITGEFRSSAAVALIELDSSLSDYIFIKNATLINDGTVHAVGTSGVATNILIQNVVTNVPIGNVDVDITEQGQAIIRDSNYK
jgi:hypothetical protein